MCTYNYLKYQNKIHTQVNRHYTFNPIFFTYSNYRCVQQNYLFLFDLSTSLQGHKGDLINSNCNMEGSISMYRKIFDKFIYVYGVTISKIYYKLNFLSSFHDLKLFGQYKKKKKNCTCTMHSKQISY